MQVIFLLLSLFMMPLESNIDVGGNISGIYTLKGTERENNYAGVVVVTETEDGISFSCALTNTCSRGIGIRKGKHISVAWKGTDGSFGSTLYEIDGKTLRGIWIAPGSTGEETLKYLRPLEKFEETSK